MLHAPNSNQSDSDDPTENSFEGVSEFLEKSFPYYYCLDAEQRQKFDERLIQFVEAKSFHPRWETTLAYRTRCFICAFAVQLTFGLDKFLLPHFKQIILYPGKYESTQTGHIHRGEIHIGGTVVFSMAHLITSQKDAMDGYNLGIHEYAHALIVENQEYNEDYFFLDDKIWQKWAREAGPEIARLRQAPPILFRPYGATSMMEFFAVSTECFFERPEAYSYYFPRLYKLHAQLLRQDTRKLYRRFKTS